MNDWRADPKRRGALAGAVLALALAIPAAGFAQPAGTGPIRLVPGGPPGPSDAAPATDAAQPQSSPFPPSPFPPATAPPLPPGLPPVAQPTPGGFPVPQPGDVAVQPLAAPDFSGIGLLSEQQGGFPPGFWRGSQRSLVQPLLYRLQPTVSPALQAMARRILLSAGEPPAGQVEGPGFLYARIERLAALGLLDDASALARYVPPPQQDANFAALMTQVALLRGDNEAACQAVPGLLSRVNDPLWAKTNAFCRALAGDGAGAEISAGLLREQQVRDPAFYALLGAMAGDRATKIEGFDSGQALHVAMLRAAKRPLEPAFVENAAPAAARAMIGIEGGPLPLALQAAERAFVTGALPAQDLARVYMAVAFQPGDLANPQRAVETLRDSRANALLFQLANAGAPTPAARAELVNAALKAWTSRGLGLANAGVLYTPIVRQIAPGPDVAWFAADAIRLLLAAGDLSGARVWQQMLVAQAQPGRPETLKPAAVTAALLQLADMDAPFQIEPWLIDWYDIQAQQPAEVRDQRATLLVVLLDTLGYQVPGELWSKLYAASGNVAKDTAPPPPPVLLRGVQTAGEEQRLGEAALMSLLVLGEAGPGRTDPNTLASVIGALRKARLEPDARRIALEAALARGL